MIEKDWATRIPRTEVNSLDEFLVVKDQLGDHFIHRGQEYANWRFMNSLHRLKESRFNCGLPEPNEIEMIRTFLSINRFKSARHNLWDGLAKMQHFGIKTRMLDFTEDIDVALFFALTDLSYAGEYDTG